MAKQTENGESVPFINTNNIPFNNTNNVNVNYNDNRIDTDNSDNPDLPRRVSEITNKFDRNVTNPNISSTPPSYSDKVKKKITPMLDFEHPTEDQGIILNYIPELKLIDYLQAIKSIVKEAKHIIAASRVSNNKIIVFLANKNMVNDIVHTHEGITIGQHFIKARKLNSSSRKIILSNVSPIIPNTVIEQYLKNNLQLQLASHISLLRVQPQNEEFSHIISWRRQVYTNTSNKTKLPDSFLLNYNDRNYRIFMTIDELICFRCHETGHKGDDCSLNTEIDQHSLSINSAYQAHQFPRTSVDTNTKQPAEFSNDTEDNHPNIKTDQNFPALPDIAPIPINQKRPAPSTSTDSSSNSSRRAAPITTKVEKSKNKIKNTKKQKTENVSDSEGNGEETTPEEQTELSLNDIFRGYVEEVEKNNLKHTLTPTNLICFVDMCNKSQNAYLIAAEFTNDITGLIQQLKFCHSHINNRRAKIRVTKIIKTLELVISSPANNQ